MRVHPVHWATILVLTIGQHTILCAQYAGGVGRGEKADMPAPLVLSSAIFSSGPGRGDDADLPPAATLITTLFSGGEGRGDDAHMPAPFVLPLVHYFGGTGRGDDADLPAPLMPSVIIFSGGTGRGDVADIPLPLLPPLTIFNGGTGRGDVAQLPPTLLLPNTIFHGGAGRGDNAYTPDPLIISTAIFSGGTGRGDVFVLGLVDPAALALWVRAYLEGPYDGFMGMHDSLRVQGLIPLIEPYSALGFPGGGETIDPSVLTSLGNNVVVDWVQVQLRGTEDPTTPAAVRNGLILTNGFIVDTDGVSPLQFSDVVPGSYHVAVLHRNHLGCMTLEGVPVTYTPGYVDLTLPYTLTFGVEARKPMGIVQVLWAGDVNHDGLLKYTGENNDRDPILTRIGGVVPTATATGYHAEDVNLDGAVKYTGEANDRDPILQNIGGVVPTATREGTVP